jgi:hypothetical protein
MNECTMLNADVWRNNKRSSKSSEGFEGLRVAIQGYRWIRDGDTRLAMNTRWRWRRNDLETLAVGSKMMMLNPETQTKHQNGPVWYNTSQRKGASRSKLSPISRNDRRNTPMLFRGRAMLFRDARSYCVKIAQIALRYEATSGDFARAKWESITRECEWTVERYI